MGFNSVYKVLQEVFPRVDLRILKAVAIENHKDADAAVEVILTKVMPILSVQSGSHAYPNDGPSKPRPSEAVEAKGSTELVSLSEHGESRKVESDITHMKSTTLNHENNSNEDQDLVYGDFVSESKEIGTEECMEAMNRPSEPTGLNGDLLEDLDGFVNSSIVHEEKKLCLNGNPLDSHSVLQVPQLNFQDCLINDPERSIHLEIVPIIKAEEPQLAIIEGEKREPSGPFSNVSWADMSSQAPDCEDKCHKSIVNIVAVPGTSIMDLEKQESVGSCAAASETGLAAGEVGDLEDETATDAMVMTRSGQICSTEFLEDIIINARSEKITLCSAKDSLISLMREVEVKEKSVEQVREEAARGGLGMLARVEDLKKTVQQAKEANDMHAGEVYGERSILTTEVRELQSRLLSLSDEKVKALAILDEMRQALEVRLTLAEKEIKAAKQEKLEKEESAQKCLAYEESIMEKVAQESKTWKQEAEENSKVRELLINCGGLLDALQGEISVLCQDVKLMKEKFDQRLTRSKSLSSSHTTSVLASSSSSLVSTGSELVPEKLAGSPENPKSSVMTSTNDQLSYGEEMPMAHKELVFDDDDGYVICQM